MGKDEERKKNEEEEIDSFILCFSAGRFIIEDGPKTSQEN